MVSRSCAGTGNSRRKPPLQYPDMQLGSMQPMLSGHMMISERISADGHCAKNSLLVGSVVNNCPYCAII